MQRAIGEEPENAEAYYQLAFCYCNWPGHSKQALQTIDRAISLEPTRADFFALRSWILGNLEKYKEALSTAEEGLGMSPYDLLALNSRTRAHSQLYNWVKSEESARETLAYYPRNEMAANFLAQALRQQGKLDESREVIARLLAHVPDSAMAQCNAGWSALQAGDYRSANNFFMEALRLDPNYDYARRGLLHAFNSRVWIYRVYFHLIAWLGKFGRVTRFFFLVIIYVVYQFVLAEIRSQYSEVESQEWIILAMVFYLILFGFGRSFGNFFLLFDRLCAPRAHGKGNPLLANRRLSVRLRAGRGNLHGRLDPDGDSCGAFSSTSSGVFSSPVFRMPSPRAG